MKAIAYLLLVGFIPLLLACSESSKDDSESMTETAIAQTVSADDVPTSFGPPQTLIICPECQLVGVTGVVDGDTIDTDIGRVRFYGVDTPEREDLCFAEATEFTRLLVGNQVRIEDGPRREDSFGRRLAYVYDVSGNSIDAQIIAGGFATAWSLDGQHKDVLVGLEESAKSNQAGCLWGRGVQKIIPTAAPTPTSIPVYSPTLVDYWVAWADTYSPNGQYRTVIESLFPEYRNVWLVAVALGQQMPTHQAFVSFIQKQGTFTELPKYSAELIPQIVVAETAASSSGLAIRVVNPQSQADADIGCWLSHNAIRLRISPFAMANLFPNGADCERRFLNYQVGYRSGEINSSWIRWIVEYNGHSELLN